MQDAPNLVQYDTRDHYDRAAEVVAGFVKWLSNNDYAICADDLDSDDNNEYVPSWNTPEQWGSLYAQYLMRMDGGA